MLEQYDKAKIGGCLALGCLTTIGLFILGGVGAYFGVTKAISSFVEEYTEPFPRELTQVMLTAEESMELVDKVSNFKEAITEGNDSSALELTARDVNYLIATDPDLVTLRDKVSVDFENGEIKSQVSVPLNKTGIKDLQGRYLNGDAAIDLGLKDGKFEVSLRSVMVSGRPIPDTVLRQLQGRADIANEIMRDPRVAKYAKFLDSVQVVGDRAVVKLKPGADIKALKKELDREKLF